MASPPLLAVEELSLSFPTARGDRLPVLDRVSFEVGRKETVALVGESGSGKTVTALAIMGLQAPTASIDGGRVLVDGADVRELERYRGNRVGMIFQLPKQSLNPLVKAGEQIARVVRLHRGVGEREAAAEAVELMNAVGIDGAARRFHSYPHQLSGGMAQRVMIAMALAARPSLLIADEPTTGLDVTIQEQIFELLLDLQERFEMSILLITHDLAVVAETCDRLVVMHGGQVVEVGPVEAIFEEPRHPYTRRLLASVLRADRRVAVERRPPAPGQTERILYGKELCRYAAKCEFQFDACLAERPLMLAVGAARGHATLCHLYDPRFAEQPPPVAARE
jgi:peptide/nickel transport system ATP-binding protein